VHGGAAVRLRDKTRKVAFIGDYTFGPSYLVEIASDGTPAKLSGRLPDYVGTASTAMNAYFTSADFPVTAALGVDLALLSKKNGEIIIPFPRLIHGQTKIFSRRHRHQFRTKIFAKASVLPVSPPLIPSPSTHAATSSPTILRSSS
jgi:hypothetical protein